MDRERLEQVIYNLATNAIIHASATYVLITIEAQGSEVVFQVTNEGAAIPPDLQDSIFDPFVQTETLQSASAHGLGRLWQLRRRDPQRCLLTLSGSIAIRHMVVLSIHYGDPSNR
jgi:light-regulated signal transduction histidine kinase (bacteriophytochrome)